MTTMVSFVGRSKSGKTTLLETIISELKSMGYRVGVIKHTPHGFDIDPDGKDTWRFSKAGASVVSAVSSNRIAFIEEVQEEPDLDRMRTLFEGKVDIILTEGYKTSNTDKILVARNGSELEQVKCNGEILATVSSRLSSDGIPVFRPEDIRAVVNLLVQQIGEIVGSLPELPRSKVCNQSLTGFE